HRSCDPAAAENAPSRIRPMDAPAPVLDLHRGTSSVDLSQARNRRKTPGRNSHALHGLPAELAASGVNVVALLSSECDVQVMPPQRAMKSLLAFDRRPRPLQSGHGVVRDEVDFRFQRPREFCQPFGLLEIIVYASDEDVLERQPLL